MKPTERFSNRVSDYVRSRPSYPAELTEALATHAALSARTVVADIGSGTGISTDVLLDRAHLVFAVEPNRDMRAAAESRLGAHPRFRSINGTAEATTLPDASVDLVTAGQAFHWFDRRAARAEFRRILRRRGVVALFWNTRRTRGSAFMEAYEDLLKTFGTDFSKVTHENIMPDELEAFFGGPYEALVFDHAQQFDFEGLRGRLLSSSYVPGPGDPGFQPMLERLQSIFDAHARAGYVRFPYDTELYLGKV